MQIEHAYETNNQRKVSIMSVSYGPQLALSFLHTKSQQWKDKYIQWFIAESPVWSGCPSTLLAVAAGYDTTSHGARKLTRDISVKTMADFWLFPRAGNTTTTWNSVCMLSSQDWKGQGRRRGLG